MMDILSARKKAAERARTRKNSGPEPAAASQPAAPEQLSRAEEPAPSLPPATAIDAAVQTAPVVAETTASSPGLEAAEAAAPVQELEMLSFRLGGEEYAVMVDDVKEVLRDRDLTPVPNAPDYILGVMALRGPVLPVIDLCRRLGLPPGARNDRSRIVVVSVNDEETGIMVDRVTGVVRISAEAVRPAPETIEHGAEFLKGIARKDDRLFILLDIGKAITA